MAEVFIGTCWKAVALDDYLKPIALNYQIAAVNRIKLADCELELLNLQEFPDFTRMITGVVLNHSSVANGTVFEDVPHCQVHHNTCIRTARQY